MNEVRLGIIGAGDVAIRHMDGLRRTQGVVVSAVAETLEDRRVAFAKEHRISVATGDYKTLLTSPDINTVLILTPHHAHCAMTLEALEAGKHVICEKPMAPTVAECDRMLDLAQKRGLQLLITHSLREEFFTKVARRRVAAGVLGKPLGSSVRWFTDEEPRLNDPTHWKGTKDRSGGGVLIDGGCHVADLLNSLLGRAKRAQGLSTKLVALRGEVAEDTACFSVEYASGALASVFLSFTAGSSLRPAGGFAAGMTVDVYGTAGSLQGGYQVRDGDFQRWCHERRTGEPDLVHYNDGRTRHGDIDVALLKALRGEAEPPVTAIDARNAVAVVEAVYESLAAGRTSDVKWREG
jgi:predicted dehydrogenase